MKTTLNPEITAPILESLTHADQAHDARLAGERLERQPVHTMYGGAHLFKPGIARVLGSLALKLLNDYARAPAALAGCIGIDSEPLAGTLYQKIIAKLEGEPIEDYRIDFEDGYGNRPDAEEDGHAISAAKAMARDYANPGFPRFIGIRIKPFTEALRERSIRTLDLFLTTLASECGSLPKGFVVTLPKVAVREQVSARARLLEILETRLGLSSGAIKLELMVETPQSIIDSTGAFAIPKLLDAAQGRCRSLNFGPYDYTASFDITAEHQTLTHPACNFARSVMQACTAGRGVALSDGPTIILPIPPHRVAPGGALTVEQAAENQMVVHRALRVHFEHVRASLQNGFYQSLDLHPGQLPARYAAVYSFFLEGFAAATTRLRNFIDKAAQATLLGDVFDDAATGQGLLNFFLRGVNCGAFTEEEACEAGLTIEELRGRSFLKILENRRARAGS